MYINEPMRKYLDESASGASTPGGGSVAALAGALGAALTSMVCNFTVGKKKYKDVEAEVAEILEKSEKLRADLTELMQADTEAYGGVSEAYGMPRKTSEEKKARTKAIQAACKNALEVPLKAAICCYDILKLNEPLVENGDDSSSSAQLGATAAVILLRRHGRKPTQFGLLPAADPLLNQIRLDGYRFDGEAARKKVRRWWAGKKDTEKAP